MCAAAARCYAAGASMRLSLALLGPLAALVGACAAATPDVGLATDEALTNAAGGGAFDYEALTALIAEHDVRSVEELLPLLPADFRSSYTLMHDSLSLQAASYEHPRVIMFGKDARLTCTFNGDPSQVGYDTLECFQFRDAERAFDFRQIRFPSNDARAAFSARGESVGGDVKCSKCHGDDPRPNWDPYDQWAGAYGSDDDALGVDLDRYRAFVAKRDAHPRYRWLIQDEALPTAPYTPGYSLTVTRRPNLRFSGAAGRLNALRATRLLETRLSHAAALGFAVGALACQLSPEQWSALEGSGFEEQRGTVAIAPIFHALGIPGREWGMSVFADPTEKPHWEHQAGYGFLAASVSMAVADGYARAGNEPLRAGIARIKEYIERRYNGADRDFHRMLAEIVPDPDRFGGYYEQNVGYVCPELGRLFVEVATSR